MGMLRYFDGISRYFSKANMPLRKMLRYFLTVFHGILMVSRVIRRAAKGKLFLLIYLCF